MKNFILNKIVIFSGFKFQCLSIISFLFTLSVGTNAQDTTDTRAKTIITFNKTASLRIDTTNVVEEAPLDIAQNRGLIIITPDHKMQLKISGSVRYLMVYDNIDLLSNNIFNTYQIPTCDQNKQLPNYFNGLNQSRLEFEVMRRTDKGNVFIRLETDFAGLNGFRIRHAYGQYKRFLLGQTWSLFSQITALPATVNFVGPTGAVVLPRTPQIRYSVQNSILGMNLALGLEYIIPDLRIPDSLFIKTFQLIPGISARLDKNFSWGYFQISGIIPVLSGRYGQHELVLKTGWGLASSAIINTWAGGKWYLQIVGGEAITGFINDLSGNGLDVLIKPGGGSIMPIAFGTNITYEHSWSNKFSSSVTYGMAQIEKVSFTPDDVFHLGYTFSINAFWDAVEGAKVGGEMIWGTRVNKNKDKGHAFRTNLLFYYDF